LHKAKILLRRVSKAGLLLVACSEELESFGFSKKLIEIPFFSNQTMVHKTNDFEKYYKTTSSTVSNLDYEHKQPYALRTVSSIKNLTSLKKLRVLYYPNVFCPMQLGGY
jgi:hypothetical protein